MAIVFPFLASHSCVQPHLCLIFTSDIWSDAGMHLSHVRIGYARGLPPGFHARQPRVAIGCPQKRAVSSVPQGGVRPSRCQGGIPMDQRRSRRRRRSSHTAATGFLDPATDCSQTGGRLGGREAHPRPTNGCGKVQMRAWVDMRAQTRPEEGRPRS